MSITDELRRFANEWDWLDYKADASARKLRAIADRIDAEHESACAEAYGNGVESVALPDMNAYVKLPKDADGEYIHVGDEMEWVRYESDDPTIVRNVLAVGDGVFFAWSDEQGRYAQYEAHAYRHHRAQTVEDVLREFALSVTGKDCMSLRQGVVEEYAKRLTLAEWEDA